MIRANLKTGADIKFAYILNSGSVTFNRGRYKVLAFRNGYASGNYSPIAPLTTETAGPLNFSLSGSNFSIITAGGLVEGGTNAGTILDALQYASEIEVTADNTAITFTAGGSPGSYANFSMIIVPV